MQRKKDKSLLQGHHSAERNAEIKPMFPAMDNKPPTYLHPYAVDVYKEFYPILTKAGTLKQTDNTVFISFCVQAGNIRQTTEQLKQGVYLKDAQGKLYVNPAEKLLRLQIVPFLKSATELGLSPKARQGVSITQTDSIKADDKLSKIFEIGI